jgi:putative PIN family toxin of toxin-antitoxin system
MKVVVDTNIIVSALLGHSGGAARQVLRLCLEGQLIPLMGTSLFLEFEDVTARSDLFESSLLNQADRNILFDAFLSVCVWTHVYYLWRPNLPDEGDNHVLELAVAGDASVIITENVRDFRRTELLFPRLEQCTLKCTRLSVKTLRKNKGLDRYDDSEINHNDLKVLTAKQFIERKWE